MKTSPALAAVAVCIAAVWAWTAGLSGPYHFDDFSTPLNDPASQSMESWLEYLPVTLRPATKLTYAVEAEAGWSRSPAPRRLVSLAIHASTAILLFALIVRLVPASTALLAVAIAGIWFLHPVHADNVLMLSGRSAALSSLLVIAALLAMEAGRAWRAGLLFVGACLARETALTGLLPLAVLAFTRPDASFRSALRALAPALLGAAAIALWILTTPRYMYLAEFSFLGRPFWQSVANQVGAVPVGLGLLFDPAALSIDYGIPLPKRLHEQMFLLGTAMYIGAAAGIVFSWKRSRAVAIGLALWLAALLPTQSVVPKLDALTNRPLSLALAGLLLAATPLLAAAINCGGANRRFGDRKQSWMPARITRSAIPCCALTMCALLTVATATRAHLFGSSIDLWRDAAAKSRVNARPHFQYARLLLREGEAAEAQRVLATAAQIDPFSYQVAALLQASKSIEESR